jgi:hypothetical protein
MPLAEAAAGIDDELCEPLLRSVAPATGAVSVAVQRADANYFVNGSSDVLSYHVERIGNRVVLHEVASGRPFRRRR